MALLVASLGTEARAAAAESPREATQLLAPERLWIGADVGPGFSLGGGGPPTLVFSPRIGLDAMPGNDEFDILAYLPVSVRYQSVDADGLSASAFGLEVGLAARLRLVLHPKLQPYADLGAGLSMAWATIEQPFVGAVTVSATTLALHAAVGVEIPVDARFVIQVQPFGFSVPMNGGYAELAMLVGFGYRLGGK